MTGKSKAKERDASIQALVNERTAAEEDVRRYAEARAEAERKVRAAQKRVRELNEQIAKTVVG
jgi:hypothetical protein